MPDTFSELYDKFLTYVNEGDEEGARNFLIENLQKFPEDVQEKLAFAFFEEAVTGATEGVEEIAELQKQGLEGYTKATKEIKDLENKIKIRDLRSKLLGSE